MLRLQKARERALGKPKKGQKSEKKLKASTETLKNKALGAVKVFGA